jgi:biopolymer transport protein ExbD
MPLKTTSSEELPTMNLTSMIDVLFLLIIFFMVGTRFTQGERQIELNLPSANGLKPMVAPPELTIKVTDRGQFIFKDKPVAIEELKHTLRTMVARVPELRVDVRADREAALHHVLAAYTGAQNAGVKHVALIALGNDPNRR